MSGTKSKVSRLRLITLGSIALACVLSVNSALSQQSLTPDTVPPNFTADAQFAARIQSQLLPYTEPATGQYKVGKQVMETLLQQLPAEGSKFSWNLRIANGASNVFSSPDGTIFVDEALAQMMGSRAGLWAAAISHEIAHVVRRDWARRYLFQKSLAQAGASQITLGGTGALFGSWVDARGASSQLSSFCQTMELEADAESLTLMTRAGFDPDFVPALYHLLEAQPGQSEGTIFDPSHPPWGEREQRLQKPYVAAGREYDRLWPDRYASPGGNSPIVVYTGLPSAKRDTNGEVDVLVPLHCQNLVGSVEVVLRLTASNSGVPTELRQLTGCTSNRTLISFILPGADIRRSGSRVQAEVSVLDDMGSLLTRARSLLPVH